MKAYQKLSHTCRDCKYRVVYIPKRRKKRIFGQLRRDRREIFHELAAQRSCEIVEGHPCQEGRSVLSRVSRRRAAIASWPYNSRGRRRRLDEAESRASDCIEAKENVRLRR